MFFITFFLQHWVEILRFIRSIWETIPIWILLFLLRKKKKNPTPFIKGIFHFHATLFYLLNKWGQVLSSHYSPAGRSYLTFLQAVVQAQRKQYWATLLHFVKEKLLRGGGKKARFCRRCCAIHGDCPREQRGTITAPELRRSPRVQGDICHGHDTGRAGSACVPVIFVTTWDDRKLSAIKSVLIASSHGFYDWKAYGKCGSALPFWISPVAFVYMLWEGSGKLSSSLPHLSIISAGFTPPSLLFFFLPLQYQLPLAVDQRGSLSWPWEGKGWDEGWWPTV